MLTDEQLEIISEALQPLFQNLEHEVIVDIARRIKKTMTYTRTAELQAMEMHRLGFSPARIRKEAMKLLRADAAYRKAVAKNTMEYKREVRKLINNKCNCLICIIHVRRCNNHPFSCFCVIIQDLHTCHRRSDRSNFQCNKILSIVRRHTAVHC